ncbi:unnamed protein product [Haemonchus placei]|uniref:Uncharacterized protein n=1 Tax=Haemonchus placei TaxID=6290 RepID=A0A3P7Z2E7_HAEPC|nr:unnamed protein product [Haemonchus placei]
MLQSYLSLRFGESDMECFRASRNKHNRPLCTYYKHYSGTDR